MMKMYSCISYNKDAYGWSRWYTFFSSFIGNKTFLENVKLQCEMRSKATRKILTSAWFWWVCSH